MRHFTLINKIFGSVSFFLYQSKTVNLVNQSELLVMEAVGEDHNIFMMSIFCNYTTYLDPILLCSIIGHKQMHSSFSLLTEGISEESKFDSQSKPLGCKAGNVKCSGLIVESAINPPFTTMFCDVCCGESNFCRDCCCILCCKTIDSTYRGYSFIKCEAIVAEGFICGHMAHLDCSLRSYMAGTVGGNVGLDAEYHCRRCDARTDLVPHVIKILRTCESIDSEDEIEKILNVAFCILRGSKRTNAKMLMNQIEEGKRKVSGPVLKGSKFIIAFY